MALLEQGRRGPHRREASEDLLHHVGLHVVVQQGLLVLLRNHLRVVVGHVAGQEYFVRRHVYLRLLGIGGAESDPVTKAVFAHAARSAHREDHLLAHLLREAENGLSAFGAVHQARLARRGHVSPELDGQRIVARNVERIERQLRVPAKLEAAGREQHEAEPGENRAHRRQTTTLTSRPGTTTTFFTRCPSVKRVTASCASASRSSSPRSADLGARMWPRSLPFTWRTSSISSCSSAA